MQVLFGDIQACLGGCRYMYTCGCECVCEDQTPVMGITLQLSCIVLAPPPFSIVLYVSVNIRSAYVWSCMQRPKLGVSTSQLLSLTLCSDEWSLHQI